MKVAGCVRRHGAERVADGIRCFFGLGCEASPMRVPKRRWVQDAPPCFSYRSLSGGRPAPVSPIRDAGSSRRRGGIVFLERSPGQFWEKSQAQQECVRQGSARVGRIVSECQGCPDRRSGAAVSGRASPCGRRLLKR